MLILIPPTRRGRFRRVVPLRSGSLRRKIFAAAGSFLMIQTGFGARGAPLVPATRQRSSEVARRDLDSRPQGLHSYILALATRTHLLYIFSVLSTLRRHFSSSFYFSVSYQYLFCNVFFFRLHTQIFSSIDERSSGVLSEGHRDVSIEEVNDFSFFGWSIAFNARSARTSRL